MTSDDTTLEAVIDDFTTVERALSDFVRRGESFTQAADALDKRADALEAAEKAIQAGASAFYDTGSELRDVSRDLRSITRRLHAADLDRLQHALAGIKGALEIFREEQAATRRLGETLSREVRDLSATHHRDHNGTTTSIAKVRSALTLLTVIAGAGLAGTIITIVLGLS
ncbi:hypothetical protein [Myceligenerans indicum]|uniref:Uncharacterized protein n=1 Tax=Myceligenerans indicum TaxID=2593663 RepID=A0ABS1LJH5_9MICO|nr:hypothetical protein [Myceligenerans indicum]MBL0886371.1 hypothetical protein [Myceligenerans indicum]